MTQHTCHQVSPNGWGCHYDLCGVKPMNYIWYMLPDTWIAMTNIHCVTVINMYLHASIIHPTAYRWCSLFESAWKVIYKHLEPQTLRTVTAWKQQPSLLNTWEIKSATRKKRRKKTKLQTVIMIVEICLSQSACFAFKKKNSLLWCGMHSKSVKEWRRCAGALLPGWMCSFKLHTMFRPPCWKIQLT